LRVPEEGYSRNVSCLIRGEYCILKTFYEGAPVLEDHIMLAKGMDSQEKMSLSDIN